MSATFESMYSSFSRMHVQRTWDAIMYAPVVARRRRFRRGGVGGEQGVPLGQRGARRGCRLGLVSSLLALWVLRSCS